MAVRVTLQYAGGPVVGHLAVVKKREPGRGLRVELLTSPSGEVHWLPEDMRGVAWEWINKLKVSVSYVSEESTGDVEHFTASVVNIDEEKMLLFVAWDDGGTQEWVSMEEDEWQWLDVERPTTKDIKAVLEKHKQRARRERTTHPPTGGAEQKRDHHKVISKSVGVTLLKAWSAALARSHCG